METLPRKWVRDVVTKTKNSSLAQLGERLFYIQDVVGSIPTGTTKLEGC